MKNDRGEGLFSQWDFLSFPFSSFFLPPNIVVMVLKNRKHSHDDLQPSPPSPPHGKRKRDCVGAVCRPARFSISLSDIVLRSGCCSTITGGEMSVWLLPTVLFNPSVLKRVRLLKEFQEHLLVSVSGREGRVAVQPPAPKLLVTSGFHLHLVNITQSAC